MNASAPRGTAHVPTLTEVVHVDAPAPAEPAPPPPQTDPDLEPEPDWSKTVVLPAEASPLDESQIAQNVLADMQRQIDLMLEYRLREAIGPVLARASDALIRELRTELASAMREIVARAVAQEIARHRGR